MPPKKKVKARRAVRTTKLLNRNEIKISIGNASKKSGGQRRERAEMPVMRPPVQYAPNYLPPHIVQGINSRDVQTPQVVGNPGLERTVTNLVELAEAQQKRMDRIREKNRPSSTLNLSSLLGSARKKTPKPVKKEEKELDFNPLKDVTPPRTSGGGKPGFFSMFGSQKKPPQNPAISTEAQGIGPGERLFGDLGEKKEREAEEETRRKRREMMWRNAFKSYARASESALREELAGYGMRHDDIPKRDRSSLVYRLKLLYWDTNFPGEEFPEEV